MKQKKGTKHSPAMNASSEIKTIDSDNGLTANSVKHKSFFTSSGKPNIKAVKQYIKDHSIPDNYFWEKAFYAPEIQAIVVPKIDKICFSYSHAGDNWKEVWPNNYDSYMMDHLDKVFKVYKQEVRGIPLKKRYKKPQKIMGVESMWDMKRSYISTYEKAIFLFSPKKHYYPSMIEVHDPFFVEIGDISVLKRAPMRLKISNFEYAYDCFSDDLYRCYKYLSEHLLLDGARTYFKYWPNPGENPYTTYLSDKSSKTAKAGIIYAKEKHMGMQDYLFIRVEILFSSPFIREHIKHGDELRLKSFINNIIFEDYLKASRFDAQALYKYLSKYVIDVQKTYDLIDFDNPWNEPLVDTVERMRLMKVRGNRIDWSSFIKPLEFPIQYIQDKASTNT